ncbi:MAG: type I-G CRISPR-associated protein Csb2 [Verrucomicrobiia bacterium]
MPIIEFTFPARRLHTTPWGHHTNEGVVEWPPAPWRVLRALIATWHLKCRGEVPEERMRRLIMELASKLPSYELPPVSASHTRHYMPVIEGRKQENSKIFDTFVNVCGVLKMGWEIDCDNGDLFSVLNIVCSRLGYLGRAESVVEARVATDVSGFQPNAFPLPQNEPVPPDKELVRLLCPMDNEEYLDWVKKNNYQDVTGLASGQGSKPKGKGSKQKQLLKIPADIFEALHCDTADLQAQGWQLPPGSKFVDYVRPKDCIEVKPQVKSYERESRPKVARFKIASSVLPRITEAVSVSERVHTSLLARFKNKRASEVISGRDADGKPLKGHRHLYIFCEALEKRDAITDIILYARAGFGKPEREAIEGLKKVWGSEGYDIQLVFIDFANDATAEISELFGESEQWESYTPFVATCHPKFYRDGRPKLDAEGWHIGSPAHDLRRLIIEAGLPAPLKIEQNKSVTLRGRRINWLEFRTYRTRGGGVSSGQPPVSFSITFPEKVRGPLAFGYGAHFGLGLFRPVKNNK